MNQREMDLKRPSRTKKIESLHRSDPFDPVQEIYGSLLRLKIDSEYSKLESLDLMGVLSKTVAHYGIEVPAYRDDVFFCAFDEALFSALTSSSIYSERGNKVVRGVFLYEMFSSLAGAIGSIRMFYDQDGIEISQLGPDRPIRKWIHDNFARSIIIAELNTQQSELKTPLSYIALLGCCASLIDVEHIYHALISIPPN